MSIKKAATAAATTLLLAVLVAGCKKAASTSEGGSEATPASLREAAFRVEGMTCASCNLTVKVAAERVRGVRSARADAEQGRAWATYDPAQTNPEQIAKAISETGYEASPLGADATLDSAATGLKPGANAEGGSSLAH